MIDDLFEFLQEGVTPYHAAATAAAWLEAAGFTRLEEADYWNLEPGKGYYILRNGSAVVAWRIPDHAIGGWRITASHSDAPGWKIKSDAVTNDGCRRLSVEGYGGMNMASWLDRPLTVAGRVLVRTEDGVETRLVHFDRDLLVIPSLAIHMQRNVNKGHEYNPQIDMQPLWGPEGSRSLTDLLCEALGVAAEDILDRDLQLVTRQAPTQIGPDGEYFLAPRIDDLECAATTLLGFIDAAAETDSACAPVWAMLDNEEVGSSSRQGAQSSFLRDVLDRILESIPHSAQMEHRALANSFLLSADNGHATHPNFPAKSDPAAPVRLGGGVLLKYNASQKYTTNALSGGIFRAICEKAGVKVQTFTNRADEAGGSTLGNLQSHSLPIPMADIGLPQLAMHSAVETAAVSDAEAMVRAVAAFYRVHLRALGDGVYTLE
ncbi:M18 family aminopeptidase [Subdoligranulum variabile]|uniref:M18 family aminopeptidase n=1 Tax=Subdoligranulum variabile DSM 15176 TaxID=411471 RepID=D1PQI3_9FIRM|nr:M18 family aminopeptidase [Subdoligranulum variabile]EFB75041.1 aminopeptidase I zinc metalloprotease (M18) [Subdoligranulum variabile DSM 15176]UWP69687.1 M18 family aminopeptidase [Subdoligranulum variabile]